MRVVNTHNGHGPSGMLASRVRARIEEYNGGFWKPGPRWLIVFEEYHVNWHSDDWYLRREKGYRTETHALEAANRVLDFVERGPQGREYA